MCLHRGNAHTIRETVLHMAELGVRGLKINRIQELGEWESAPEEVALSQDESLQLYLDYIPRFFEDGAPISIMLDGAFSFRRDEPRILGLEYERPCATDAASEKGLACGVLKSSLHITPDGTVCPCMSMSEGLIDDWPNAFETPLREILSSSLYEGRSEVTIGQVRDGNDECRRCEFIDRCSGGCRAAAIAVSPSLLAPDPSICHFYRNGWYDRFKEVSKQAHEAFLANHPELAIPAQAASQDADEKDAKPFSNC